MTGYLPSILVLSAMAAGGLWLTLSRGGVAAGADALRPAVRIAAIAVAAQAGHFAEELATGLHERLPESFDLPPMSRGVFVWFNVAWLGIWIWSAWGLARRQHVALFPLWFLGIASVANGLLHPLLALNAGSYYPGLVTAPLVAIVGGMLLARLARVTRRFTDSSRSDVEM